MPKNIQVIKRDHSLEDFNLENIIKVLKAAGLEEKKAVFLAQKVVAKINNSGQKSLTSLAIKELVYEELVKINKYIAGLYKWYEDGKEKN